MTVSVVLWGVLLLMQPAAVLVLAAWIVLLHFRTSISMRRKIALALLPILITAPWIARNWAVFHRFVFIRDNFGLVLASSNNSCAQALYEANRPNGCLEATDPNASYGQALRVRELGEVEYNRVRAREAMVWIKANPGRFVELTAQRFVAFWLPTAAANSGSGSIARPWVTDCFTLLGIPGLWLAWKRRRSSASMILLWLVFYPPAYYLVQVLPRYRYPSLWASFLAGSYFLVVIANELLADGQQSRDEREQEVLAEV